MRPLKSVIVYLIQRFKTFQTSEDYSDFFGSDQIFLGDNFLDERLIKR